MKRNEAIELLDKYNKLLMDEGYADSDLRCETPTAIDKFLNTEWAKENLPIPGLTSETIKIPLVLDDSEKEVLETLREWKRTHSLFLNQKEFSRLLELSKREFGYNMGYGNIYGNLHITKDGKVIQGLFPHNKKG